MRRIFNLEPSPLRQPADECSSRPRVYDDASILDFGLRSKPDRRSVFDRRSPIDRRSSPDRVSTPLRRSLPERLSPLSNSMPMLFGDRHTRRHRVGVLSGKYRVNLSGMSLGTVTDTRAPVADRSLSMPASGEKPSPKTSLTG